ncbi:MAG: hypothetical protein K0S32_1985 [Bacteroidetes bacterium]|jgi:antitoxin component YwqK of YwqJK toxin-antitoxin module|nr:hypothetical protein [Bacteroidota bacterium]
MKFQINNGLGKIFIGLCDTGNYFHFEKPLVTTWYDYRGSVGKYLCSLPYSATYRNEIRNKIVHHLNTDFTDRIDELRDLLDGFLRLFRNGTYSLNYYHGVNNSFFRYTDHESVEHEHSWYLLFSEPLRLEDKEKKIKQHEVFVHEQEEKKQYAGDLVDFTTNSYYDEYGKNLLATQPKSEIDSARVKFFEQEILSGKRPAAIVFNCCFGSENGEGSGRTDYSMLSDYYVLDGHHKLQAYENLKINPSIIEITHLLQTSEEIEFNPEELTGALFPWQLEHLIDHWDDSDRFLKKYLDNPDSKLHQIIKNGHHQDYYTDGKIKHEACYINNKIEGEAMWWYDNGQLKQFQNFKKGLRTGVWRQWYKSGAMQFIQPYNDAGQINGTMVSYFENGQKRWEQTQINGISADGYSYLTWYEDGSKEAELKYENGKMIERKNYDKNGALRNFEEFDPKQNRLVKRK